MRRAAWVGISLAAFLAVLGVLYVLIGNLAGTEMQSAAPAAVPPPDRADPEASPLPEAEPRAMAPIQVTLRILVILAVLVFVFGMIFSRRFRRDFLQRAVATGVTLAFMILFAVLLVNRVELASSDAATEAPTATAAPQEEESSSRGITLALAGLSVAAVLAGAGWAATRLVARRRRPPQRSDLLEEIGEAARTASSRLRAGDPLSQVVLECYQEMSLLLAREEHTPFDDYLTPREFARRLRSRGMESAHAERLTHIFEIVRYGGKSDAALAEEAMTCLTSVRDRYAAVSP